MKPPQTIWQEYLNRGELAYQQTSDGRAVFFPRVAAPADGAPLEWKLSRGTGVVHATTVVYRKGEPALNVALVELDEGFRMMSRVAGIDATDVRIGMRVRFCIEPAAEGHAAIAVFKLQAA
jgi:uncharacterized OB-fold protein